MAIFSIEILKKILLGSVVLLGLVILIVILIFLKMGLRLYFSKPAKIIDYPGIISQIIKIDELEIYYKTAGSPQNPPLVYIHGLGGVHELQEELNNKLIDALSESFYVYAPELSGQRRSEVPSTEMSPEYYVDFVHAFITQLNIQKPILAGQSYGGKISAMYSTKHENTISLVVIGNSGSFIKERTFLENYAYALGFVMENAFKYSFVPNKFKYSFARYILSIPEDQIDREDYQKYAVMGSLYKTSKVDYSSQLTNLKIPFLIIWGKNDKQFNVRQAYRVQKYVPHARVELFDAEHPAMATYPDKTRELILEEWKKIQR